jgi:3-oxoacyl-[acyl-carrier-protein] synthase II
MRRVAITGIGSINAHGVSVAAFAAGLRDARCAIGMLSLFPSTGYRSSCAAQVAALPLPAAIPGPVARRASRTDRLALIAAAEALATAGLGHDSLDCGVVLGGTTGGMYGSEECVRRRQMARRPAGARAILPTPVSTSTDLLAQQFGCGGPRLTVSTACSSGGNALGIAADWVRWGRVPAVLCGGADSLCRMTFSGFNALQALDTVPCRPFDRRRAGLSLGEGAAMFVLEDFERARARGATVYAEFVGYGVSADAHHITQPRPDGAGALLAMQRALEDSGVHADEIDYVNAHGTGTPLNDVIETRALHALLGVGAHRVPVSSTKSMIGHCLAAAGAIEALACVVALREGFVPATATLVEPDPECDLDYVPRTTRTGVALRTVLSNSYGFGGNNTSIVLRAA